MATTIRAWGSFRTTRTPPTHASLAPVAPRSWSRASPPPDLAASLFSHGRRTLSARLLRAWPIFDTMESINSPVSTLALGHAYNNAGFLLGAGTKGLRVAMPLTRIALQSPAVAARGQNMKVNLPLDTVKIRNDFKLYLATLKVTGSIDMAETDTSIGGVSDFPLYAKGKVVRGFGRGSKQMGIPTANLNPEDLPQEVRALTKGVYFGWAQVRVSGMDERVHKMVMNIGNRPTFADSEAVTVEVHIMHNYKDVDFYGEEAAIVVLGFIRPELKFKSLDALVERIQADVGTAKASLEDKVLKSYQTDRFFKT